MPFVLLTEIFHQLIHLLESLELVAEAALEQELAVSALHGADGTETALFGAWAFIIKVFLFVVVLVEDYGVLLQVFHLSLEVRKDWLLVNAMHNFY